MSSAYATKVAEGFSQRLLKEMYDISLLDTIVNRDYEGEINGVGSKLNILALDRIHEQDYTKGGLVRNGLYEKNATLEIEKKKSFYWAEYTIDKWLSYIKNPHETVVTQKADERNMNMDKYALGFYGDVAAGNRIGTNATAGTVTVDASGNVTGDSTAFTAAMVGRGFKATGQSAWYRVKSYASATSIVIEDDLDDVASTYSGGAVNAGTAYIVEAATPLTVTTSNLLDVVAAMKLRLDTAEQNGKASVPDMGRFLIVPPEFELVLPKATGIALHVPEAYQELVKKGMITMLQGFMVFKSNRLTGNNTDGYHMIGGHANWLTFAEKLLQAQMEEDIQGDFGTAFKDLFVYGGKVSDTRRHFATEAYVKFTVTL